MNWKKWIIKLVGKVAQEIVPQLLSEVMEAEGCFGEAGSGERKKERVLERLRPSLRDLNRNGSIDLSVEDAEREVGRMVDGTVALLNLTGVFDQAD